MRWHVLAIGVFASLGGCATPVIITSDGPAKTSVAESQFAEFNATYKASYGDPDNNTKAALLLRSGLTLVDTNCLDYFRSEGQLQHSLNLVRDSANALVPIAAGAFALRKATSNTVGILTLSSAATAGAISVVANDFLFDADNIQSVQQLVSSALAVHEDQLNQAVSLHRDALNFDWTVRQIMEHQVICEGPSILSLAKQAIQAGNVQPYNVGSNGGGTPGLTQKDIDAFNSQVAEALGVAAVTNDEVTALYWFLEKSDAESYLASISPKLSPLGTMSPIGADGKPVANWTPKDKVKSLLDNANILLKSQFDQQVGQWLAAVSAALNGRGQGLAANVAALPVATITQVAPALGSLPTRIGVRIEPVHN